MLSYKYIIGLLISLAALAILSFSPFVTVSAQGFGSNPDNYYCASFSGIPGDLDEDSFRCIYTREDGTTFTRNALIKPPPITILQIWFVRILYIIWAVSGVGFTFILIGIGIRYMLSFGNEMAVEKVIQGFQKWVLGLVLVFLSYPILVTFFNLLPISQTSCFSNIEMPGFQFFFPEACVSSEQP